MTGISNVESIDLLGTRVDATSYERASAEILLWAREGRSAYVCAANVQTVMEGHDSTAFREAVNASALVTPDGMPLVWYMRALGVPQDRVYGPDLMLHVCGAAARGGIPVGLYGTTDETLRVLKRELPEHFPGLTISFAFAPPFAPLGAAEELTLQRELASSGARILFVALGCPKQELWMHQHLGRLSAVMIGVGAAFDFHAGNKPQAPAFLQRAGLEWLFRLATEPRRLTVRYLKHNPRFLLLAGRSLIKARLQPSAGKLG